MPLLNPGEHFPPITITPVDGEPIDLPDALAGHFAVILFNRGSWCPYCNAQLRAFQRHAEQLDGLDVKVVSLSVDDEATVRELVAKHGLRLRRARRGRRRDPRSDRRVRQRRPGAPAVHRVRPRSRRERGRQRLFQRRDRPPGTRRCGRPGQLRQVQAARMSPTTTTAGELELAGGGPVAEPYATIGQIPPRRRDTRCASPAATGRPRPAWVSSSRRDRGAVRRWPAR